MTVDRSNMVKKISKDAAQKDGKDGKAVKKRTPSYRYGRYIGAIRDNVAPGWTLSNEAVRVLDAFVRDNNTSFATIAEKHARRCKRVTVSARELQCAIELKMPRALADQAIEEGNRACSKFVASA